MLLVSVQIWKTIGTIEAIILILIHMLGTGIDTNELYSCNYTCTHI